MANYMKLVQYASQLDNAWGTNSYYSLLDSIKKKGYKVLRNSRGKHKLEERNPFGDIFGDIWNGNSNMTWGE